MKRQVYQEWLPALTSTLQTAGINFTPRSARRIVRSSRTVTVACRLPNPLDYGRLTERVEEALALTFGVPSVRVSRALGMVNFEVTLPKHAHKPLPVGALKPKGGLWFSPGLSVGGTPVHINLNGRYAHGLVAGATGCGKTTLLRLLIYELAKHNGADAVQIAIVDGKGGARYRDLAAAPHVRFMATDTEEALRVLAWTMKTLSERKATGESHPITFLVIDEIREIIEATGGPAGKAAAAIASIASIGRELGVRIIVATQHPKAEVLGGRLTSANLQLRLAGAVTDASASNLITGIKGLGAQYLYGEGDFIIAGAEGHRFQAAYLEDQITLPFPSAQRETIPDLSLDRVLTVAGVEGEDGPTFDVQQVGWGIADYVKRRGRLQDVSANAIREEFNIGMNKAREVRDLANEILEELTRQGITLQERGVE